MSDAPARAPALRNVRRSVLTEWTMGTRESKPCAIPIGQESVSVYRGLQGCQGIAGCCQLVQRGARSPWDGQGLERVARYCARPPFARERFALLEDGGVACGLPKPAMDGRTLLVMDPLQMEKQALFFLHVDKLSKGPRCSSTAREAVDDPAQRDAAAS